MRSLALSRNMFCISIAVALLAGCGGSQPPIATPGAMPQSPAVAAHADRSGSWMLPEASGEDLLYVAGWAPAVYVYTYPQGNIVGKLSPSFFQAYGECVDGSGNVFIVTLPTESATSSTIYEYAHGGTSPIATLTDPNVAFSCSVDPTTGDLAAAGKGVAVFQHASGNPTLYSSPLVFLYCGYDNSGNLYLSAEGKQYGNHALLVRFVASSGSFQQIKVDDKTIYYTTQAWPSVQWDGEYMTISSYRAGPLFVYRLRMSVNRAKAIATMELFSTKDQYQGQLWIQGSSVLDVYHVPGKWDVGAWSYPRGGSPRTVVKKVSNESDPFAYGLVVSEASSR